MWGARITGALSSFLPGQAARRLAREQAWEELTPVLDAVPTGRPSGSFQVDQASLVVISSPTVGGTLSHRMATYQGQYWAERWDCSGFREVKSGNNAASFTVSSLATQLFRGEELALVNVAIMPGCIAAAMWYSFLTEMDPGLFLAAVHQDTDRPFLHLSFRGDHFLSAGTWRTFPGG